ncbi:hypothetical protein [Elizabethkingia ursingii]|uniref:Uncharacterized protein n=1 Tax=Elizabethkingia ursingii TaxID=1756150 RepID=A0AAJ3NAB3_9FLAO|nr:hypothetical protein [Elizabethkingia ursingii]AQX08247.1 hypothetical protein BBD34_06120 [Elizabethkingia ursingii]OPB73397.1 hypothetical protein BAY32_10100 [Elizabethkingia ursingii]OPB86915.1 hypothetical protein BB021_10390 [Elizabethkingia ursingii]
MKEMNNNTKREYVAPELNCVLIEIEQGIAAGSATLRVGAAGSDDTPQVQDWNDAGGIGDGGADF